MPLTAHKLNNKCDFKNFYVSIIQSFLVWKSLAFSFLKHLKIKDLTADWGKWLPWAELSLQAGKIINIKVLDKVFKAQNSFTKWQVAAL
jgi:hypothetical protein